jgi:fructose/tagatose bisphosphate aldolase
MYSSVKDLVNSINGICQISQKGVKVVDKDKLSKNLIDSLVYNSVFNEDANIRDASSWIIWESAKDIGIYPSSIQGLYEARGRGECEGFTVPAMNIRGMTYDSSRAAFRAAIKNNMGPFIFEIARSEMGYTEQRPKEYTTVILGAAIKEGFSGPVFIQGDHFQFPTKKYNENPDKERNAIKDLIKEAVAGGFYNIDIDSSTLVELDKPTILEQQTKNYTEAANITAFIRETEPKGITISVGGEIGEVGTKNSTPEDLDAFMEGYNKTLNKFNPKAKGLSKISVQTGTSHGGVVLPDGTMAKVNLDFETLRSLSEIARDKYGMSGAVQHGASTLPADEFHRFPEVETAEVHLATEFQNMIYENSSFPKDLKKEIYTWLHEACADEKKPGQTEEQFIYKSRKKGLGHFKKKMWDMPESVRASIGGELEKKFSFLFQKLGVINTKNLVDKFIKPVKTEKPIPSALGMAISGKEVASAKTGKISAHEAGYHSDEIGE